MSDKQHSIIGAGVPRIDGPDKLAGRANYAADNDQTGWCIQRTPPERKTNRVGCF